MATFNWQASLAFMAIVAGVVVSAAVVIRAKRWLAPQFGSRAVWIFVVAAYVVVMAAIVGIMAG